jgi:hypothetical protein
LFVRLIHSGWLSHQPPSTLGCVAGLGRLDPPQAMAERKAPVARCLQGAYSSLASD